MILNITSPVVIIFKPGGGDAIWLFRSLRESSPTLPPLACEAGLFEEIAKVFPIRALVISLDGWVTPLTKRAGEEGLPDLLNFLNNGRF